MNAALLVDGDAFVAESAVALVPASPEAVEESDAEEASDSEAVAEGTMTSLLGRTVAADVG